MIRFSKLYRADLRNKVLCSLTLLTLSAFDVFGQSYSATLVTPSSDMDSQAVALNLNGAVAGTFRVFSGSWHAFLFNGKFFDLGTLGGPASEAVAMNGAGDVVGASDLTAGNIRHAFLYHAGQLTDLNGQGAADAGWVLNSAVQITDAGQIIALGSHGNSTGSLLLSPAAAESCTVNSGNGSSAFLPAWSSPAGCFAVSPWTGQLPSSLSLPSSAAGQGLQSANLVNSDGSQTQMLAFNSLGDEVGYFKTGSANDSRAVLLPGTTRVATDLNSQIRMDAGWTLNQATAVNDYGQIVGNGLYQGHLQAFLLTPLQTHLRGNAASSNGASATPNVASSTVGAPALTTGSQSQSTSAILSPMDATGTAGGVLAGTYPNPVLAGITGGPVVFGNGTGTVGQDSSFFFNGTTKQLNLTDALNVYNSATLNLGKGAGSSSSLDLQEADNTGKFLRVLQPGDQLKKTPTLYLDNGAGMYMRSWLTVSGTTNGLTGDGYAIVPPSKDALMIGVWADVPTGLQVRTGNIAGAYNYSNLDRHGNYTMSVEEDGSLRWGTSTRSAMDTGISRDSAGVLQVNTGANGSLADLKVRNLISTGNVQFMNTSSGTGAAALGSNSPATALGQPFTWVSILLPDGSTGYTPVWK